MMGHMLLPHGSAMAISFKCCSRRRARVRARSPSKTVSTGSSESRTRSSRHYCGPPA